MSRCLSCCPSYFTAKHNSKRKALRISRLTAEHEAGLSESPGFTPAELARGAVTNSVRGRHSGSMWANTRRQPAREEG